MIDKTLFFSEIFCRWILNNFAPHSSPRHFTFMESGWEAFRAWIGHESRFMKPKWTQTGCSYLKRSDTSKFRLDKRVFGPPFALWIFYRLLTMILIGLWSLFCEGTYSRTLSLTTSDCSQISAPDGCQFHRVALFIAMNRFELKWLCLQILVWHWFWKKKRVICEDIIDSSRRIHYCWKSEFYTYTFEL